MNHDDNSSTPDLPENAGLAANSGPAGAPVADTAAIPQVQEEDLTGMIAEREIPMEVVRDAASGPAPDASAAEAGKDDGVDEPVEEQPEEPTQNGTVFDALATRVDELEQMLAEEKSHRLRVLADLDNWRKRSARDLTTAVGKAQSEVVVEFLPVLDNLELALEHTREGVGIDGMREGVAMVLKQFRASLAKFGILEIDASRQPFDPMFHEAMAQNPSDEVPAGFVIKQWQKGFMLGDRLIRPCRVVVSSGPGPQSENTPVDTSDQ
jgi:molecular chaperone GrpE